MSHFNKFTTLPTDFKFRKEKGQRIYGPPCGWIGPTPPRGCEIFIGKLPYDVFEDELIPLFGSVGIIYEFRLMIHKSGVSRGFAFVNYINKDCALRAIKFFNNYPIRQDRYIGVVLSVDRSKLYIRGLPATVSDEAVLNEFRRLTDGVVKVTLCRDDLVSSSVIVEYESHKAAANARRILLVDDLLVLGRNTKIDWLPEETKADEKLVTSLYVKNIPVFIENDVLFRLFSVNFSILVTFIKRKKNYAFVHYYTREDAECALKQTNGLVYENWFIEVFWAKAFRPKKSDMTGIELPNLASQSSTSSNSLSSSSIPKVGDFRQESPGNIDNYNLVPSYQMQRMPYNPVKRLENKERGGGLPEYQILRNPRVTEYASYMAKAFIPNYPGLLKQFVEAAAAKNDSALLALTKLGFQDSSILENRVSRKKSESGHKK